MFRRCTDTGKQESLPLVYYCRVSTGLMMTRFGWWAACVLDAYDNYLRYMYVLRHHYVQVRYIHDTFNNNMKLLFPPRPPILHATTVPYQSSLFWSWRAACCQIVSLSGFKRSNGLTDPDRTPFSAVPLLLPWTWVDRRKQTPPQSSTFCSGLAGWSGNSTSHGGIYVFLSGIYIYIPLHPSSPQPWFPLGISQIAFRTSHFLPWQVCITHDNRWGEWRQTFMIVGIVSTSGSAAREYNKGRSNNGATRKTGVISVGHAGRRWQRAKLCSKPTLIRVIPPLVYSAVANRFCQESHNGGGY